MELYLDTSTPEAVLTLAPSAKTAPSKALPGPQTYRAPLGHEMAEKLLSFIAEKLKENHASWQDLTKITYFSGPGSFTGLRIGAAVVNSLAHELNIPLFDHHGTPHQIILPDYGRPARITPPKK